jgi:hypothetical protein
VVVPVVMMPDAREALIRTGGAKLKPGQSG